MDGLNSCSVCLEEYEDAESCPKLLPCTHTVCLRCLVQLLKGGRVPRVQCPECRTNHEVPNGKVQDLPTNRYVLAILALARRQTRLEAKVAKQQENVPCLEHDKPCVMFCGKCWEFLCVDCPPLAHQNHSLMSLADNLQDVKELDQMKEEVKNQKAILAECHEEINQRKKVVAMKAEDAQEAVNSKIETIIEEAEKVKEDIRKKSEEEMAKLEGIRELFIAQINQGQNIQDKIDMRPKTTLSQSVSFLGAIKEEFSEFKKSAKEERNKTTAYEEIGFKKNEHSSPLGKIVSAKKVIRQSGAPLGLLHREERENHLAAGNNNGGATLREYFDINDYDYNESIDGDGGN